MSSLIDVGVDSSGGAGDATMMEQQEQRDVVVIGRGYMGAGVSSTAGDRVDENTFGLEEDLDGGVDIGGIGGVDDAVFDLHINPHEATSPITNIKDGQVRGKKERSPLGQLSHNTRSGSGSGSASTSSSSSTAGVSPQLLKTSLPSKKMDSTNSAKSAKTMIGNQSPSTGRSEKEMRRKIDENIKPVYDENTLASMKVAERRLHCLEITAKDWKRIEGSGIDKRTYQVEDDEDNFRDTHPIILIDDVINEMMDYYLSIQENFTTEMLMQTKQTWINFAERIIEHFDEGQTSGSLSWSMDEDCNDHNKKNDGYGFQLYNRIAGFRASLREVDGYEVYPVTYALLLDKLVAFANTWSKWRICYPFEDAEGEGCWDGKRENGGTWVAISGKKAQFRFVMDEIVEDDEEEEEIEMPDKSASKTEEQVDEKTSEEESEGDDESEEADESMEYIPPPSIPEILEAQIHTPRSEVQTQIPGSIVLGGSPNDPFSFKHTFSSADRNRSLSTPASENLDNLTQLSRLSEAISESTRSTRHGIRNLTLRISVVETNTCRIEQETKSLRSMERLISEQTAQMSEVLTLMHTQASREQAREVAAVEQSKKLMSFLEKLREEFAVITSISKKTSFLTSDDLNTLFGSLTTISSLATETYTTLNSFQKRIGNDATLLHEIKQMLETASLPDLASAPMENTPNANIHELAELSRRIHLFNERFHDEKQVNKSELIKAPTSPEDELAALKLKSINLTSTPDQQVKHNEGKAGDRFSQKQPRAVHQEHDLQFLWPQGYPVVGDHDPDPMTDDADASSVQDVPGVLEAGRGKTSPGFCSIM